MPSFITCHSQSIKYFTTRCTKEKLTSFIALIRNDETTLKEDCFLVYVEVYHIYGGFKISYNLILMFYHNKIHDLSTVTYIKIKKNTTKTI